MWAVMSQSLGHQTCQSLWIALTVAMAWQRHREDGVARTAGNGDVATVRGDDRGHDGQTEAGTAGGAGTRLLPAGEAFEDVGGQLRRNAGAVVAHPKLNGRTVNSQFHKDIRAG